MHYYIPPKHNREFLSTPFQNTYKKLFDTSLARSTAPTDENMEEFSDVLNSTQSTHLETLRSFFRELGAKAQQVVIAEHPEFVLLSTGADIARSFRIESSVMIMRDIAPNKWIVKKIENRGASEGAKKQPPRADVKGQRPRKNKDKYNKETRVKKYVPGKPGKRDEWGWELHAVPDTELRRVATDLTEITTVRIPDTCEPN